MPHEEYTSDKLGQKGRNMAYCKKRCSSKDEQVFYNNTPQYIKRKVVTDSSTNAYK